VTTFQRRRLVLGLVLFALIALVALLFAIPKIQDDRVEAAESQLRAAGITGVVAQFSGRDGTLLGPAAQEEEALAAVTDRDGMRSLEYEATDADDDGEAIATTTTTVAAGGTTTTTTVAPGQALQVSANVDGRTISLTGTVASDAEKKLVLDAAAAAFGPANVADQVVVSNGVRDEPSAGALVLFSQYLGLMGRDLDQGSAQVSGTTMAVAGTGFTKESAAALAGELEKYRTAAGLTVSGSVAEPTPPDAAGLQANLSDISGRSSINFASGSAQLDAPSQQVLDVAAQSILAGPVAAVEIGGHTDSEGTETNNQRLSLQRAEAVRTYLITKGVAAPRLVAKGFGSTVPIADNATPEGRAQNRRIEFVVTGS
jgi:OOP family OmpA-OmpF porin